MDYTSSKQQAEQTATDSSTMEISPEMEKQLIEIMSNRDTKRAHRVDAAYDLLYEARLSSTGPLSTHHEFMTSAGELIHAAELSAGTATAARV